MFTEQEIEWQTELEKQKLVPILELLKGTSFEDGRKLLLKALEKLTKVKEELIF
jgi:hypothetical protein